MALLDDDVRKASVIATKACECFVLDRETFSRILNSLQHAIGKETKNRLEVLKGMCVGVCRDGDDVDDDGDHYDDE